MLTLDQKPVAFLTGRELTELHAIVQPYYVNAHLLFSRELTQSTYIYLCRVNGRITAFFMVSWGRLYVNGRPYNELQYRLSSVSTIYQNTMLRSTAYLLAVLDITSRPVNYNNIGWFTTATPTELQAVDQYWQVRQPDEDGLYQPACQPIAEAVRQKHYSNVIPSSHPFVLKAVTTDARYTESDSYCNSSKQTQNNTIFDNLGVQVRNGDRLLVLVDLPNPDRRTELKRELAELINEFNMIYHLS